MDRDGRQFVGQGRGHGRVTIRQDRQTFAVGAVGTLLTAIPLAMACALGAILAPTDAVAVSTVARRAGLPRRLVSILEGESLVNDGTGLTALTVALAAAAAGTVTIAEVSWIFVEAVVVGVGIGAAGGFVLSLILRRSNDLMAANALVLIAPFLLYAIAENLDGSGILALVVAALVIAVNWVVYILAVVSGRTYEAALGYFLNPIVTVALGVLVLKERLRPLQWAAVAIGALAGLYLTVAGGVIPWIPAVLALSFATYGLVKKRLGTMRRAKRKLDELNGVLADSRRAH